MWQQLITAATQLLNAWLPGLHVHIHWGCEQVCSLLFVCPTGHLVLNCLKVTLIFSVLFVFSKTSGKEKLNLKCAQSRCKTS